MSFLNGLGGAAGAAGAMAPNAAASGLGGLIGVDPSRISSIANSIGGAAGKIASAGAAPSSNLPPPNNYMQMLDPNVLRAIMAQFGGSAR